MSARSSHGRGSAHEPRLVRDILESEMTRLTGSDRARAYKAWARASVPPVSLATRPGGFHKGVLVVECESSVWANELTLLSAQILARMHEVAPGHPVTRLRFVVGGAALDSAESHDRTDDVAERRATQNGPPPTQVCEAVRLVAHDRLRRAIETAVRTSYGNGS